MSVVSQAKAEKQNTEGLGQYDSLPSIGSHVFLSSCKPTANLSIFPSGGTGHMLYVLVNKGEKAQISVSF